MAREPSRRFITNVVNFASKPWNVAGREVQELIRKILESDQEGRPAEHRLLDPISHQDTERADPTDGAVIRGDGTNWKVADKVTVFDEASAAGTYGFLNVTGTLPTGTSSGSRFTITSNAASTSTSIGLFSALLAGSTANSYSAAGYFSNGVNPSGTAPTYGIYSVASGSSATKIGIQADAVSGTTSSTGIRGTANSASGYQIGGDFRAYGAGTKVGIHASLTSATAVTAVNTAALFDNAAVAASIAIFRDNGTTVFSIQDGGGITVKTAAVGSTTLDNGNHVITADATAGAVTYTLPAISATTRGIWYRIKKIDATANTVTIARTGADTIDGAVSQVITLQYQSIDIICPSAGTDWLTLGASSGLSAGSGTDDEARAMAFMAL